MMIRFENHAVAALALLVAGMASASHVQETISLDKGWNAVYLETTPDEAACANFFAGTLAAVERVGAYLPSAYDDTAQYDSEGNPIDQKPVSYYVWSRSPSETSTFEALAGGFCYLIYATNACAKTFLGTPAQPNLVWRAATPTDGMLNFVAPSIAAGTTVGVKAYCAEGPAGTAPSVYQIAGQGSAPTMLSGISKLAAGKAYAMTAGYADRWPGVIQATGLSAGALTFGTTSKKAAFTLMNRGTSERTFRLTPRASESPYDNPLALSRYVRQGLDGGAWSNLVTDVSWEVTLAGGASQVLTFGIDRTNVIAEHAAYGALIEIADVSGTSMRVRIPVTAKAPAHAPDDGSADAGLWVGGVALDEVSTFKDAKPIPAAGTLKLTALVHIDRDGHATLLPRVTIAYGADENTVFALYHELADVPAEAKSTRRITGLLLPTSAKPVKDVSGTWGERVSFTYAIDAMATDNPFRHAWHPDHDGVNALYDAARNDGVETWSVTNKITFAWKQDDGTPYYPADADGLSAGKVTWEVAGIAKTKIVSRGLFSLKKVLDVKEISD